MTALFAPAHRRHVAVVGYHGYPSEAVGARRLSELAIHLAGTGFACTQLSAVAPGATDHRLAVAGVVLAGVPDSDLSPSYTHADDRWTNGQVSPLRRGLAVVPGFRPAHHAARRFLHAVDDKKRWSARLARRLFQVHSLRRIDAVIASGPPFSPVLAAAVFCRAAGVKLVVDFRDPWVSADVASPSEGRTGLRRRMQQFVCATATVATATTEGIIRGVERSGGCRAAEVIPNGYDRWMVRGDSPSRGVLRVLHAGSIYYNRDPGAFLRGASAFLRARPESAERLAITFLGHLDPDKRAEIEAHAGSGALSGVVTVRGRVPPAEAARYIRESTVLLTLAQGQPEQIPAKIYEHIASRRAMLVITEPDSATARAVSGYPWAVHVADDADAIRDALALLYHQLVDEDGRLPCLEPSQIDQYSRGHCNDRFAALLHGLT